MQPLPHFRWNYAVHAVDGGLFMGGIEFISASTVLPSMISSLGGPVWLISLMPVLMWMGVLGPPLLTAHYVDGLQRYHPFLLITGAFMRLPYLAAALVLFACPTDRSSLAGLAVAAAAPGVAGIICGLSLTAWHQLLLRTVPISRLSSLVALRYGVACIFGLAAGWIVRYTLQQHPGTPGYARLFAYTFSATVASLAVFAFIREPVDARAVSERSRGLIENLGSARELFGPGTDQRRFLWALLLMNGLFVAAPFLAIHACRVLGRPESFVGALLMAQMFGSITGNVFAGWLGDRCGAKRVLVVGQLACVVVAGIAIATTSTAGFLSVFFVFGFAFYARQVGCHIMSLELSPRPRRATFLAVTSAVQLLSLLIAAGLSSLAWGDGATLLWNGVVTIVLSVAAVGLLLTVPEPRQGASRPVKELSGAESSCPSA